MKLHNLYPSTETVREHRAVTSDLQLVFPGMSDTRALLLCFDTPIMCAYHTNVYIIIDHVVFNFFIFNNENLQIKCNRFSDIPATYYLNENIRCVLLYIILY